MRGATRGGARGAMNGGSTDGPFDGLRVLALALLGCGWLAATTFLAVAPAAAHGGNPKPGAPPPPQQKDPPPTPPPLPPAPPPPPPPKTPGSPTPPAGPQAPVPGPPAPTTPPPPNTANPPRPATGGAGGGQRPHTGRPGGSSQAGLPGWRVWWEFNRLHHLPTSWEAAARRVGVVTVGSADPEDTPSGRRDALVRTRTLPFLLRLLRSPETPDEVAAAACLALARLANDGLAVGLLEERLGTGRHAAVVEESAALAFGMLRRTEPERQASPALLDRVRRRLLETFDDPQRRWRTRALAMFALGVLGDQPGGGPAGWEGARTSRELVARLTDAHRSAEDDVALLSAIGLQPRTSVSSEIAGHLEDIVVGRRFAKRPWSDAARAHALTALARLDAAGWVEFALRTTCLRRTPGLVRQAAFLAIATHAPNIDAAGRETATEWFRKAVAGARTPTERGFAWLAAGRLVGASLAAGSEDLLQHGDVGRRLEIEAANAPAEERAFATLGRAFMDAARARPESAQERAERLVPYALALGDAPFGPAYQGASAVALAIVGCEAGVPPLQAVLDDASADPDVRGLAGLALATLGDARPATRRALVTALWDRARLDLGREAALALSLLPRAGEASLLVPHLADRTPEHVRAQVAMALGRLGDGSVAAALIDVASDRRASDETRALAVASLGLLGDPEPRPSLERLVAGVVPDARSAAMHEAWSIL